VDKRGEIVNRWLRVFEAKTPDAKRKALAQIGDMVADDVYYLMQLLKEAESKFAQSLSGISSQYGQLIISEDGILKYKINGKFVDIKLVSDGLREFTKLCNIPSMYDRVKNRINVEEFRKLFEEKL